MRVLRVTLERRTPLRRGKPLKRGGPIKRGKPLAPTSKKATRKPPRSGDVSAATRRLVMHRANYRCEVGFDGCQNRGLAPHHRLSRKHGNHEPENLVVVCVDCHTDGPEAIHRNRARSIEQGLIIPSSRAGEPIEPWIPPWWLPEKSPG